MDAEADRLFKPIVDGLNNALRTAAVFELIIPANAFRGMKMPGSPRSLSQVIRKRSGHQMLASLPASFLITILLPANPFQFIYQ